MSTRLSPAIRVVPAEQRIVGKNRLLVTPFVLDADPLSQVLYRTVHDEWWEECPHDGDHSLCYQCGGQGIVRIAGSEKAMMTEIRYRIRRTEGTLNALERAQEKRRERAQEWQKKYPDVTFHLVRLLTVERRGILTELALKMQTSPLTDRQRSYAEHLLRQRAYAEAHLSDTVERTHIGLIGDHITFTGQISVLHTIRAERHERHAVRLIVVTVSAPDGSEAHVKTVSEAAWVWDVRKGETVTLSAIVSGHTDTQMFGKQTLVAYPRKV